MATLEILLPGLFSPGFVLHIALLLPVFLLACVAFLLGFLVLGLPIWTAAHLLGRRHWYDAAVLGALVAAGGYALIALPIQRENFAQVGGVTAAGWTDFWLEAAMVAIAGASAGFTISRIAYRER